jgi:DNA/RNA-binding domain of Phe-tRNA-synthetase-like protein
MKRFYVDERITAEGIPALAFSVTIEGTHNLQEFECFVDEQVKFCLKKYADVTPKEVNAVMGYRMLHERFGEKSKKIAPAPEALIKLLKKKEAIPRISPLVDLYNLISAKYALALGAHDLDKVNGNICLKFSVGGEVFIPLGTNVPEEIYPNEYGYFDDETNEVLCRLEARQSDTTKTSNVSKNILLIIQGNINTSSQELLEAKTELFNNLKKFINLKLNEEFVFLG